MLQAHNSKIIMLVVEFDGVVRRGEGWEAQSRQLSTRSFSGLCELTKLSIVIEQQKENG